MPQPSSYNTVFQVSGPYHLKKNKSIFLGWVFPVNSLKETALRIDNLWKQYPDATHVCYAYRVGIEKPAIRMNDDGEPAYSAGTPIYQQIESANLFNVMVCVVRYYGGTKLGVGGLIQAYRETARGALRGATLITKVPVCMLTLDFQYPLLDSVMRFISQHQLNLRSQRMELDCSLELEVPMGRCDETLRQIRSLGEVKVHRKTSY